MSYHGGMIDDPIPALKKQLAAEVLLSVDDQHWMIGASLLGLDYARMCHLRKGRIERFSVERLIRMLVSVNRRVDVAVVNTGPERIPWVRELFPHLAQRKASLRRAHLLRLDPIDKCVNRIAEEQMQLR